MYLGILNEKIYDICSDLKHKRDASIDNKDYLDLPRGNWYIGDTWDSEKNLSLKDSPQRFIGPEKTELEKLKERIVKIETKLEDREVKD